MKTVNECLHEIYEIFDGVYKCNEDEYGNLCVICADGDGELDDNYGEYWDKTCPGWREKKTEGMDADEIAAWNATVDRKMAFEALLDYGRSTNYRGSCYARSLDSAESLDDVRDILDEIISEQTLSGNAVTERADRRFEQAKKLLAEIENAIDQLEQD